MKKIDRAKVLSRALTSFQIMYTNFLKVLNLNQNTSGVLNENSVDE